MLNEYQKVDINVDWFNNKEKKIIEIPCNTVNLLIRENDVICYLLALNVYPHFQPQKTICSYVLENGKTGYLIVCGNNYETIGHTQFRFTKEG